jgi:hypothetical protein
MRVISEEMTTKQTVYMIESFLKEVSEKTESEHFQS